MPVFADVDAPNPIFSCEIEVDVDKKSAWNWVTHVESQLGIWTKDPSFHWHYDIFSSVRFTPSIYCSTCFGDLLAD